MVLLHGKVRGRGNSNPWPGERNPGKKWALRNAEEARQTSAQGLETSLPGRLISTGKVGDEATGGNWEPHLLLSETR